MKRRTGVAGLNGFEFIVFPFAGFQSARLFSASFDARQPFFALPRQDGAFSVLFWAHRSLASVPDALDGTDGPFWQVGVL